MLPVAGAWSDHKDSHMALYIWNLGSWQGARLNAAIHTFKDIVAYT
jgi:hypothetical protein